MPVSALIVDTDSLSIRFDLHRCHLGYMSPFCAPDPTAVVKAGRLPMEINANRTRWSDAWGYETCSANDQRDAFTKTGTRGLISDEMSLAGMKYMRIQLDQCANRSQAFDHPIQVQLSLNNGILWKTLASIVYRHEAPTKPWLIEVPDDEAIQHHRVRIRLFQRVPAGRSS